MFIVAEKLVLEPQYITENNRETLESAICLHLDLVFASKGMDELHELVVALQVAWRYKGLDVLNDFLEPKVFP